MVSLTFQLEITWQLHSKALMSTRTIENLMHKALTFQLEQRYIIIKNSLKTLEKQDTKRGESDTKGILLIKP